MGADRNPDVASGLPGDMRRLNVIGLTILLVLFGGFGTWASFGKLSGAVVASGVLVVQSNVRRIQHPTGGIIADIAVGEGSLVETDQLLIKLDETQALSALGIVESELFAQLARAARLTAERDGANAIAFPDQLIARFTRGGVGSGPLASEQRLFDARRTTLNGERAQLQEQVFQTIEQTAGLDAQRRAKADEVALIEEELAGLAQLYAQNLVPLDRLTTLRRNKVALEGELGQLVAAIATTRARVSELELQILQLDKDLLRDVLDELREVDVAIATLQERRLTAEDQLRRIEIRSPIAGTVLDLAHHTIGGVVAPGETLMLVVPRGDELLVDAKVTPSDIDQVVVDGEVALRILSGNRRTTPMIGAKVVLVSPDLTQDSVDGQSYYRVRLRIDMDAVDRSFLPLFRPGVPVEAFIQTEPRTALAFLLDPLREQLAHTFLER